MTRRVTRTSWWARGLMLLSAILLFAAPVMPAVAAPTAECCAQAPCHDQGQKAPCPDACLLACHVLVAPEAAVVGSVEIGASLMTPMRSVPPPGRALPPELPPPR
jgi:hypothetical protein